ncbi:hypothetical protein EG329_005057 [Mollisiaceae sp. DMI_Dod_QoI]|nr:hypothetical protein EG329_005057 [Helotiales sp. DMI_Dod_QoI]
MPAQSKDFVSNIPDECKYAVVSFLTGKDAANLRLASRAWRDIAAEGLFKVYYRGRWGYNDGCIVHGVLVIRPSKEGYGHIADGLIEWPWMGQHIKEIEIYLADKLASPLVAAGNDFMNLRWDRNAPWPKHRLLELCPGDEGPEPNDFLALDHIFSRLSNVEALSVFSKRCPFIGSEEALCELWDKYMWHEYNHTLSFGHGFQDIKAACTHYLSIFEAIRLFKLPIRKLVLELVPFQVFECLYEMIAGQVDSDETIEKLSGAAMAKYFNGSLTKVCDLQMDISTDLLDGGYLPSMKYGTSTLSHFLGLMLDLKSLTLISSDMNDTLFLEDSEYLENWGILQTALYRNFWPSLETLRLQEFRTPDNLLLRFLTKHASSLRRLSLIGCFLGYSNRDRCFASNSWATQYCGDNFRGMLEELKDHAKLKLDELKVCFRITECTPYSIIWECYDKHWKAKAEDVDWKAIPGAYLTDSALLERFLRGQCPWPMASDNPDLRGTAKGSWMRLPEWTTE